MQALENNAFKDQYPQNGDNSQDIGKSISGKRFIECIRCGKQIKNDPTVIKNHEYYCRNKEIAAQKYKVDQLSSENEYSDNNYKKDLQIEEKATVGHVSDKTTNNSGSFSGIVIIGIIVGIIGAILFAYKILAQIRRPGSNITQTPMDNGELTLESPEMVRPWAYLFPIN